MIFSMTPQVFSVLCLAVVSVAGQWTGNYNTTPVADNPIAPPGCQLKSLQGLDITAQTTVYKCVCTGGQVFPSCNWLLSPRHQLYNSVRNATCKCAAAKLTGGDPRSLNTYGRLPNNMGFDKPGVVRTCICDPVAGKGDDSTDKLVETAGSCWCPADRFLWQTSLSDAKESQAVPEMPPSVGEQSTGKQTEPSEAKESQGVPETPSSVDKQSTTQQPGEQQSATASIDECRVDPSVEPSTTQQPGEKQPAEKQPATGSVQWTGNYNTTGAVLSDNPPRGCELESRLPRTILAPCVCTGGKVIASCNWQSIHGSYNTVRDANCKCQRAPAGSTWQYAKDLVAYGLDSNGQNLPGAVRGCGCDPAPGKGDNKPDESGLVVPGPNCLCPTRNLEEYSGLSEAEESQQPGEQQVPTGSFQRCRDDLNKGKLRQNILCKQLMEVKPKELPQRMQSVLPNCSISSLTEICKDIPQD